MGKAILTHGVRPLLLLTEPQHHTVHQLLLMELRDYLPLTRHLPRCHLLMEPHRQSPMRLPHLPHRMGHRHLSKVSVSSSSILPSKITVSNLPQRPFHLNKIPLRSGPHRQGQLDLFQGGALTTLQILKRLALDSLLLRGAMEIMIRLMQRTELAVVLTKNRHLLPFPLLFNQILL